MLERLTGYDLAVASMAGIESHPEHHKQETWSCGTGGCLAGWAVSINKGQTQTENDDLTITAARLLFGSDSPFVGAFPYHANIFQGTNSKGTLYRLLAQKYDVLEEVFRKDVQAYIEAYDDNVFDPWENVRAL